MNSFRKTHGKTLMMAAASSIAISVLLPSSAIAQLIADDEIVVTAQKKEENIQEVGISVTAFSGDAAREFGFTDSTDIVAQVPGLNVGTPVGEGNNPSFSLRGVGLNDFNDNNEGPIAVYVDDVYQAALPGLTFQLFDTERVEVLRGPQGTLYGRNATGGLIHFISRRPTEEFEGYLELEAGSYDTFNVDAALSGAIADGVRARFSAAYDRRNGYVENRIGRDANAQDTLALRGQLEFDVGENGLLNLKGFYSDADANSPAYQHQATLGATGADNLPFCAPDVARDIYCYADTDGDNFSGEYDNIGRLAIESYGFNANYTHDFGGVTLTNIFSYQETEKFHQEDTDQGPLDGITAQFTSDIQAITNELRLSGSHSRGSWLVGAFFLDTEVVSANDVAVNWRRDFAALLDSDPAVFGGLLDAGSPGVGLPGVDIFGAGDSTLVRAITFDVDYTQDTRSWAGFANFDYALTDSVKLTGGIRYTTEDRTFDYINQVGGTGLLDNALTVILGEANYFSLQPGDVNGFNFAASGGLAPLDVVPAGANVVDDDNFLGRATLDWQASDDLLLFATWSRGFKAGGFNAGFLDQTDGTTSDQVRFDAEVLTSYEAGFKWTAPSNNIRINATGFYYDYDDFQALTFQGLSQLILNTDATFYGGEAEIGIRPFDGLDAQLGISYLDTDVDGVTVQGVALNNREAVLAPEITVNGFVRYAQPVYKGELAGVLSFNYQGEHFFDITNSDISREDGYFLLDARLSYVMGDQNQIEFAVFGKNLTDKEYRVYTFDFTGPAGFNQQFFGPPRWFGGSVALRF